MADKPAFGFGTPFAEQLDFFRRKINLPSDRWDDIKKSAHDRAFIVAGAGKADLLDDLRGAMDKRIADGKGLNAFRKEFDDVVKRHGWSGWTGEGSRAGVAWRTRVIYQTNMASSYAAGRWAQLNHPDLLKVRPYWRYHHADGVLHPRPHHLSWNGITLRHDHLFWKTHFAPNGWLCHCYISAASAAEYARAQAAGKGEPPTGWDTTDPQTGAPPGIDKGFDHAPGANVDTPLRQMVQDKLISYAPAISKALAHDLNRYVLAHDPPSAFAADVLRRRDIQRSVAFLGFAEDPAAASAATGRDLRGYMGVLPADTPRHVERAHQYDGGNQRPVVAKDYDRVWLAFTAADNIESGHATVRGLDSVVVYKEFEGEMYRAVYEIRPGKKARLLALVSLIIKTGR